MTTITTIRDIATTRFMKSCFTVCFITPLFFGSAAHAGGDVGEHVNDLQAHLDDYNKEVVWLIKQVDGIVDRYESDGVAAAKPEAVVEHWEAVDFHAAIETNYIQLYSHIWQGLFGVREAIENKLAVSKVRAEQNKLEQTLWQSLGAVKVAAEYQKRGLLPAVEGTTAASPVETMDIINRQLGRVVAKYAEKLPDEATKIVQETYLTRFEGVEGMLIEKDADLVEDLEIDFNVRLPKAISNKASLDEVRGVVEKMNVKLDKARNILVEVEKNRKDIF